jgi:hypothetical protein
MALTPFILAASIMVAFIPSNIGASSHREAPLISSDPDADGTDFYMFIAPNANNAVTFVANYIPFEAPEGAPNFNKFSDNVLYEINVDNVGDGKRHITYQFRFKTKVVNSKTFLYNTGTILPSMVTDSASANPNPTWSIRQTYDVLEVKNIGTTSATTTTIATNLPTPPSNIGEKSTPNYEALANAAITTKTVGGDTIKLFAGQRDDPFWVDLGSIFDLLSLRGDGPLPSPFKGNPGYSRGPTVGIDNLSGFNTHSIVLQVPINRLLQGAPAGETVIGGWTTASRPKMRVLNNAFDVVLGGQPGFSVNTGPYVQVSRLGLPLTNEAVIPLALKDAFNSIKPQDDATILNAGIPGVSDVLYTSVFTPELQTLLYALYGVPYPGCTFPLTTTSCNGKASKPRTDIADIFLFGMKTAAPFTIIAGSTPTTVPAGTNVNRPKRNQTPATTVPAEMLRLNTATAFRPGASGSLCSTNYSRLGVLGGDVCGFPNGRRLYDDAVEIELLAVAGAAYPVLTTDTSFKYTPVLSSVLTDGVDYNDVAFLGTFPYVATPHQGQEHTHTNLNRMFVPKVARSGTTAHGR